MPLRQIFVSYAYSDGAELAQHLVRDLAARGLKAWLDNERLYSGAIWTREIENAIDQAEVVLAFLTRGSDLSEICRAEQLRALRKGKGVIPLLAQSSANVPLHLEAKQYLNFAGATGYQQQFEKLIKSIIERDGVILPSKYRNTYITAPPLPRMVKEIKRPWNNVSAILRCVRDNGRCAGVLMVLKAGQGRGGDFPYLGGSVRSGNAR